MFSPPKEPFCRADLDPPVVVSVAGNPPYASSKMAANGRTSNIARIIAILPASTRYHSATRAVPLFRYKIEQNAYVAPVDKNLPGIGALDKALELLQRFH
jgi:hypothetical protein